MSRSLWHPRQWPAWWALALLAVLAQLPRAVLAIMGALIGQFLYFMHASRRRIVAVNLARCFPALSGPARRALARAHFRALGRGLFDAAFAWFAPPWRIRRAVRFVDRHCYDEALARGPVILLVPHFVALEMGIVLAPERAMATIYKRGKSAVFNWAFVARRGRFGGTAIEVGQGVKPAIRALKRGEPLYYLPDQDLGEGRSVFAPFCGVAAATVPALAALVRLTGASVVPLVVLQRGTGYEAVFMPPLRLALDDAVATATQMNAAIEAGIALAPAQYFWVHKRFKTRPPGEPGFY